MDTLEMQREFLARLGQDAAKDYEKSLADKDFPHFDYCILTASNERQAEQFRMQIRERAQRGQFPCATRFAVIPDPEGKRVGSGGATLAVLAYLREQGEDFTGLKTLVIHSGGDSKRVPQYSAIGKLFSPVPREKGDGSVSTLFDEFLMAAAPVPQRIKEGMLILSGDVILQFNALQIGDPEGDSAAISFKEPAETGSHHGVFLRGGNGYVRRFLHKQTVQSLTDIGAVDRKGMVDLDTGAVLLSAGVQQALYGLVSRDGIFAADLFDKFVNDTVRISFYGDILFPLAEEATLEEYLAETPEGSYGPALEACRRAIWEALLPHRLRVFSLAPAKFIHFGTTAELSHLMAEGIRDYAHLGWKKQVASYTPGCDAVSALGSYGAASMQAGDGVYLEDAQILGSTVIGDGAVISGADLNGETVPGGVVLHVLPLILASGARAFAARIYGVKDNPKDAADSAPFLGSNIENLKRVFGAENLWQGEDRSLWNAALYPVCDNEKEAVAWALAIYEMLHGNTASLDIWKACRRVSLCESFNLADVAAILERQNHLALRIRAERFRAALEKRVPLAEALTIFGREGLSEEGKEILLSMAETADFSLKIRLYFGTAAALRKAGADPAAADRIEKRAFDTIAEAIQKESIKEISTEGNCRIAADSVTVELPLRVNWGGGWTDTPPICIERGGIVLNAAIRVDGKLPVQVKVEKLDAPQVVFASLDGGVEAVFTELEPLLDCSNPYDSYALHKAALLACGILPLQRGKESLADILGKLGGGIRLATQVAGIPKGSGLGTSSILAGACVKALFRFLGMEKSDGEIYPIVLAMEQLMSTGGGWQDQVGGLTEGVKLITTEPGVKQDIKVQKLVIPEDAKRELAARFVLIYSGQRRLAKNILRDVLGGYISGLPSTIEALDCMEWTAKRMTEALEQGDVDAFAALLDRHWDYSRQLDAGSSNTCIDAIFAAAEDLLDARFVAGAGGGGFLQGVLKKGVTKEMLADRLYEVFGDSGVFVWNSDFIW